MICPKCNANNTEDLKFCGNCGTPLKAKGGGGGLKIALITVCALLAVAVTVLVLVLTGVIGKKETLYRVFVDDQEEGTYTAGSKVTIDYPIGTDTDYDFFCDEVKLTESYKNNKITLKFVMPSEDVYIYVDAYNTMSPVVDPEPEDPEPDPARAGEEDLAALVGTWYGESGTAGVIVTIEKDGTFSYEHITEYGSDRVTGYLQYEDGNADWGIPGMIKGSRFEMYGDNGTFLNLALTIDGEMMTMLDGGGAWRFTHEKPDNAIYQMGAGGVIDMFGGQYQNDYAGVIANIWEQSTGLVFAFGIEDASFIGDATYDEANDRLQFDAKDYASGTRASGYVEKEGDSIRVTFTVSDNEWITAGDVYTLDRVY